MGIDAAGLPLKRRTSDVKYRSLVGWNLKEATKVPDIAVAGTGMRARENVRARDKVNQTTVCDQVRGTVKIPAFRKANPSTVGLNRPSQVVERDADRSRAAAFASPGPIVVDGPTRLIVVGDESSGAHLPIRRAGKVVYVGVAVEFHSTGGRVNDGGQVFKRSAEVTDRTSSYRKRCFIAEDEGCPQHYSMDECCCNGPVTRHG